MAGRLKMHPNPFEVARNHPARRDILRIMRQADAPMSPVRITEEMAAAGASQTDIRRISYHVRKLVEAGVLVLSGTRKGGGARRGATEHFYRIAVDVETEIADAAALDSIAERLRGKTASAPDLLGEIDRLVRATGRMPVAPPPPSPPQEQPVAPPVRPTRAMCACAKGPADDEGTCFACGKQRKAVSV